MAMTDIREPVLLPDNWEPACSLNGFGILPDWHGEVLREIARQLGVGSDAYYPLIGAAAKLEMYRRGEPYADAIKHHGGAGTTGDPWKARRWL